MTRRDVGILLPALATAAQAAPAEAAKLPSLTRRFEDLPVKTNGENRSRDVLDGLTHTGYHIDMHQTELGPGLAPHAPHEHEHEEMVMIREGELEVTIDGKVSRAGPGGTIYVASMQHHGWRNVSKDRAHYFVIALGRKAK